MRTTDYKKFNKKTVSYQNATPPIEFNSTSNADNMRRLYRYSKLYSDLDQFRDKRDRNIAFSSGDQYRDKIKDERGRFIREDEHIMSQGKVPIANNMIGGQINSVLGQFRSNQTEPICVSRDRDEAKLGEMMSVAIQYVYQTTNLWEKDAKTLEENLNSGLAIQKIRYKWIKEKSIMDVDVDYVNPERIFFDGNFEDPSEQNFTCIGEILDMNLADVISTFCAGDKEKAIRISKMYSTITRDDIISNYRLLTNNRQHDYSFFTPVDRTKCRVIEAWEEESKERLRVHDTLTGELFITELSEKKNIDAMNLQRVREAYQQGVAKEDVLLMEYEWFLDQFMYVRYLTPMGDVLFEGETPFEHKESPYVIKMSVFNGKIRSFTEDLIPLNKGINRLATLLDFIISSSPKGVMVFPESALGDMNKAEIISEYQRAGGVIFANIKAGNPVPTTLSTNATNVGAYDLLNLYMNSLQEVSGVHSAMQGKTSSAGTPASLYAQQAQNSSMNLLDKMESFKQFREMRDYKVLRVIQQYYTSPRYINLAGNNYSAESKYYDPKKVQETSFDLVITESNQTPVFRSMANDLLVQLFSAKAIGVKEMLKVGNFPFGDKLLQLIDEAEKNMQQGQQMNLPTEIQQQLQQGANPQATEMLNQAEL